MLGSSFCDALLGGSNIELVQVVVSDIKRIVVMIVIMVVLIVELIVRFVVELENIVWLIWLNCVELRVVVIDVCVIRIEIIICA
ncbi:4551_t:CDS:2 [Dentiscutata heterogama]|uniref:4551_t:CDS:1 n=1 Tax=Dentiscutata heterogama TaxID=1316150 RepID=A0ACA9JYF6_9GLOM|nr:4551_t:CDS:2 [Dentiscutata heterogama]